MKQITSIIIILIATYIICSIAFIPVRKGLSIYYGNNFSHLTEILENKTDYDLIFIGASRTIFQVYPKIIDSICGLNSYNAGITGARVSDFELILKGYLVNHPKPKIVVFNIDLISFGRRHEIRQYPEYYFFLNNKAVEDALSKNGYHPYLVKLLPFSMILDLDDFVKETALRLLKGKGELAISKGLASDKGFIPLDGITPYSLMPERLDMYDESIQNLQEIIDLCKSKQIGVIFTYSPEYNFISRKMVSNYDTIMNRIADISQKNNIVFLRDDSLAFCKNKDLFWNDNHLNKKGAMIYSESLGNQIKNIMKSESIKTASH